MKAEELIAEVADVVQDPESYPDDTILRYLNLGQVAIAGRLLLPDLSEGHEQVTTVIDDKTIPVPDDYHKGLYLVQLEGQEVPILDSLKSMSAFCGGLLDNEDGEVRAVCVNSRRLIYQDVPVEPVKLDLFYYRMPTPMTDSPDSYPDGMPDTDSFQAEWYGLALVHYACSIIFSRVEDGMEGAKVNTKYHQGQYELNVEELSQFCNQEGRNFPPPITNKLH